MAEKPCKNHINFQIQAWVLAIITMPAKSKNGLIIT
jgi:hypothetical protein